MNTFLKDSPWYGDVLLSACIFGYVHVSSGLTPLAFSPMQAEEQF